MCTDASRQLQEEDLDVKVYERAPKPGGVWVYSDNPKPCFASAQYFQLAANFPRDMMEISEFPWEKEAPRLADAAEIEQYLVRYAAQSGVTVKYDTEVVDLHSQYAIQPHYWKVKTMNTVSGKKTEINVDAVVVAVGTFEKPFIPDYEGLP
jgi:cation diffusion facilitator CzcD-associated flavoprotein CzcO